MTRALGVLCGAAVALGVSAASAEPTEQERALANSLFEEGRRLMTEGRVSEACPKFAGSQRLQPGGGTLLNLGLCHEKEGKIASAWGELRTALALARRDRREDRERLAAERLAVIEPELSMLVVEVPPAARVDGLVVTVDGLAVPAAAWGAPQPIDPGPHAIAAQAPGHAPWSTSSTVDRPRLRLRVEVPALTAVTAPVEQVAPQPTQPLPLDAPNGLTGQHTGALVAGGFAVVGIALGTGFGLAAAGKWSTAEDECPTEVQCSGVGEDASNDAAGLADLSSAAFVVGTAALGLGAVLWLTAPPIEGASAGHAAPARRAALRIGPGRAQLDGRF